MKNLDVDIEVGELKVVVGVFGRIISGKIAKGDDGKSKSYGYVMCKNRGMVKVTWKPLVKMLMNGNIMIGNGLVCGIRKEISGASFVDMNKYSRGVLKMGNFVQRVTVLGNNDKCSRWLDQIDDQHEILTHGMESKNGDSHGECKFDILKWPNRKKKCMMFDDRLKLRGRGAKFDIWEWAKRKKKRVMFDIWKWPKRKKILVCCFSNLKEECHGGSFSVSSFGASFISSNGQSGVNGVNPLCGIALLPTPYAVKKGGWVGLSIMFVFCVLSFYNGTLLRSCLDSQPGFKSNSDIGEAAFGIVRRLIISIVLYILTTLVEFPTVWLRDSSVLNYISAGGLEFCYFWGVWKMAH